jgi:hypothetical protein
MELTNTDESNKKTEPQKNGDTLESVKKEERSGKTIESHGSFSSLSLTLHRKHGHKGSTKSPRHNHHRELITLSDEQQVYLNW